MDGSLQWNSLTVVQREACTGTLEESPCCSLFAWGVCGSLLRDWDERILPNITTLVEKNYRKIYKRGGVHAPLVFDLYLLSPTSDSRLAAPTIVIGTSDRLAASRAKKVLQKHELFQSLQTGFSITFESEKIGFFAGEESSRVSRMCAPSGSLCGRTVVVWPQHATEDTPGRQATITAFIDIYGEQYAILPAHVFMPKKFTQDEASEDDDDTVSNTSTTSSEIGSQSSFSGDSFYDSGYSSDDNDENSAWPSIDQALSPHVVYMKADISTTLVNLTLRSQHQPQHSTNLQFLGYFNPEKSSSPAEAFHLGSDLDYVLIKIDHASRWHHCRLATPLGIDFKAFKVLRASDEPEGDVIVFSGLHGPRKTTLSRCPSLLSFPWSVVSQKVWKIRYSLSPGESGAAVFDSADRLIGMAIASVLEKNLTFVVPAHLIFDEISLVTETKLRDPQQLLSTKECSCCMEEIPHGYSPTIVQQQIFQTYHSLASTVQTPTQHDLAESRRTNELTNMHQIYESALCVSRRLSTATQTDPILVKKSECSQIATKRTDTSQGLSVPGGKAETKQVISEARKPGSLLRINTIKPIDKGPGGSGVLHSPSGLAAEILGFVKLANQMMKLLTYLADKDMTLKTVKLQSGDIQTALMAIFEFLENLDIQKISKPKQSAILEVAMRKMLNREFRTAHSLRSPNAMACEQKHRLSLPREVRMLVAYSRLSRYWGTSALSDFNHRYKRELHWCYKYLRAALDIVVNSSLFCTSIWRSPLVGRSFHDRIYGNDWSHLYLAASTDRRVVDLFLSCGSNASSQIYQQSHWQHTSQPQISSILESRRQGSKLRHPEIGLCCKQALEGGYNSFRVDMCSIKQGNISKSSMMIGLWERVYSNHADKDMLRKNFVQRAWLLQECILSIRQFICNWAAQQLSPPPANNTPHRPRVKMSPICEQPGGSYGKIEQRSQYQPQARYQRWSADNQSCSGITGITDTPLISIAQSRSLSDDPAVISPEAGMPDQFREGSPQHTRPRNTLLLPQASTPDIPRQRKEMVLPHSVWQPRKQDARKFFAKGKVFRISWPKAVADPTRPSSTSHSAAGSNVPKQLHYVMLQTKVTSRLAIDKNSGYVICCPIITNQGVLKERHGLTADVLKWHKRLRGYERCRHKPHLYRFRLAGSTPKILLHRCCSLSRHCCLERAAKMLDHGDIMAEKEIDIGGPQAPVVDQKGPK